jgi:hypothetical protein
MEQPQQRYIHIKTKKISKKKRKQLIIVLPVEIVTREKKRKPRKRLPLFSIANK